MSVPTVNRPHTLQLWRDGEGQFRWRRKAGNGKVIGASTEGFTVKASMWRNAKRTNPDYGALRIVDVTGTAKHGGTLLTREPNSEPMNDKPLREYRNPKNPERRL